MKTKHPIIAIEVPITITAAAPDDEEKKIPCFDVVAYTGQAMNLAGWDRPLVIDVKGVKFGKSIIANMDHDPRQRVGHVINQSKDDGQIKLGGKISADTNAAREVVQSSANGFPWQASVEATPDKIVEVAAEKTVTVNGQEFTGPLYVAAKSTIKGFAFVSHGADDATSVSIAAGAASSPKETKMKTEVREWILAMLPSLDVDSLSEAEVANIEADYAGREGKRKPTRLNLADGIEAKRAEATRVDAITEIALTACERRPYDIDAIKTLAEQAIEGKWTVEKFRLELLEASLPPAHTVFRTKRDERLNSKVLEAATCTAGRLANIESMFDDQTLQAAHDRFKRGIGLKQLILMGAEANGYNARHSGDVTIEAQRAAFGMIAPNTIQATTFSTIAIPDVLSNVANKFLREGWMAVDQTPLSIAAVRSVRDFKQITTVSLTGDLIFRELTPAGEIQHGTLADETYNNQADTYARMLAITRKDIINDDLGALTSAPRRLGRGGMLKLNDIFWKVFLDNALFFTAARTNVSTVTGALTTSGLQATETIFMSLTDPDGLPLGITPKILLVPTAQKATALQLMTSENLKGSTDGPDGNIWRNRFRVESSPYMHNAVYTGSSALAWYLLAEPAELPVIEIVALNGNVMPVVETADADFNVLGIQMRGYSDVGVALQEYRGGVRADGT